MSHIVRGTDVVNEFIIILTLWRFVPQSAIDANLKNYINAALSGKLQLAKISEARTKSQL